MRDPNVVYVVTGYVVTAGTLAGYVGSLLLRARRARARAAGVAGRRAGAAS